MSDQVPPHGFQQPTRRKGKKSVAWRSDPEILRRVAEVDRRHLRGESRPVIASALDIDETTVNLDRRRATQLYRERAGDSIEEQRADRIRQLEEIVRTALGQARFDYEAAKAVLFGTVAHDMDGNELQVALPDVPEDFRGVVKMPEFKGQPAAALNVARQALMDVAKLQGLVVEKVSPTDPDGRALDLASLMRAARTPTDGG